MINTTNVLIFFLIADDTCLLGANAGDNGGIMMTVVLQCTVLNEVPQPIPLPTLMWFRDGVLAASASFGSDFEVDMAFLIQFPILFAGVFDIPILLFLSNGSLVFSTIFTNITNATLGNLPVDTTPAQARAMLFDILLANWTCAANNTLGLSTVEHQIRMCGKYRLHTEVQVSM